MHTRIKSKISKNKIFITSLFLLVFQSLWVTFSAIYPLPFDEYYHIGLTKIYSAQWSPFIAQQPIDASIYGDITRTISYFFHYIMSFPYRLVDLFADSQYVQVVSMRLLNVLLVIIALIIYRKVFIEWGVRRKIVDIVILFFILTPIVPFLTAHHSYDNLLILLSGTSLLLVTALIKDGTKAARSLYGLLLVGLLGLIIKDQFLPIFVITCIAGLYILKSEKKVKKIFKFVKKSVKETKLKTLALLLVPLMLFSLLVVERYGVNVIKFGSMQPKCEVVQPVNVCEKFMPWFRNQQNLLNKVNDEKYGNPASFTQHWISKITRGYFAIFSHTPTNVLSQREPFGPIVLKPLMPIPIMIAYTVMISGLLLFLYQIKRLWDNKFLRLAIIIVILYLAVLWTFNFKTYQTLGVAQAIQARYTLPIMLLIYVLIAEAFRLTFKKPILKIIFYASLILFVWGGAGITGYLIRADETWYWQNDTVILINTYTQNFLKHIVIH